MTTNRNLGEKEILGDILMTEKHILSGYSTALGEASCGNMRQVLLRNFTQTADDHFSVYNEMVNKGYYQAKDAQDQEVQQAKQKFQQLQSQL